jgi:replicative DNA helicase
LKQLEAQGWRPDLIIVDYLDLLKPLTSYSDEYADLGAIAVALRGLAGELGVPVWTATQANRMGMVADVIDLEHVGDSVKKVQVADVVLALCSKPEERNANLLRIFGAKNRNGPAKFSLKLRSAYDMMMLSDITQPVPVLPGATDHDPAGSAKPPGMPKKRRRKKAESDDSQAKKE